MNNMLYQQIDPNLITQPDLHAYLLSAVAPRPICLASTISKEGDVNLSPFSFFNVFSSNPPIMIFSPSRRGRDNTTKHTLENVLEVDEVVVNIVNYDMVEQMSLSSIEYARGINEFDKSGFTQLDSVKIKPPRVGEAPVAFECKVEQIVALGDQGGAGNLVIARVVMIHVRKDFLDDAGKLDSNRLDLVARMGGSWYCRASGSALFEIPKPLRTEGIGVDQLPKAALDMDLFTGNELGRLGNLESMPSQSEIDEVSEDGEVVEILSANSENADVELYQLAKKWLSLDRSMEALCILLLVEQL